MQWRRPSRTAIYKKEKPTVAEYVIADTVFASSCQLETGGFSGREVFVLDIFDQLCFLVRYFLLLPVEARSSFQQRPLAIIF